MAQEKTEARDDEEHIKPKNKVKKKVPFYKLYSFADPLGVILMIIGAISAVANGFSQPFMTLIFGNIVNTFGSPDTSHIVKEVSKVAVLFVYLAVGSCIASFLQVSCWVVTGERQASRIRGLYLETILKQDIAFFDNETTTERVIRRMSGGTILIQDAIAEKVGKFIQLVTTFICGCVIAFTRGWLLSLVLLPCVPLFVIVGGVMSMMTEKMSSRGQIAHSEAGNVAEQTIESIRTVASFSGEKRALEKYQNKIKIACNTSVQQGVASGLGMGVLLTIIFSTYGLAMWYGSILIIEKGYSGGAVLNIIMILMTGGMALVQTSPCLKAFVAGQAAAYRMFKTIKRKPQIDAYDASGVVLEDLKGDIELKDVYFTYPAVPDVQVFAGFSLYVPSGTTAALVGQSRSGKSTIISLLERFYDPDAGEVLVDGVNLRKFQLRWIREKIGLVGQEPVLFAASIKENIVYGKEGATDEEITAAITLANAKNFIDKLPKGLDTMVGLNGTQLSGAQKQRIAIARAILKKPRILLLDEVTSALDAVSERTVQEALEKVMSNRTTVVVAHRLTNIRDADTIAVVHQGKIVEKGTHDELIKDPEGAYSQLICLQEVAKDAEASRISEAVKSNDSFSYDSHMARSANKRTSMRSISRGSSSSQLSVSLSFTLPYQIAIPDQPEEEADEDHENSEPVKKQRQKFSIKRLVKLNMPELPALLLGSIAAATHGVVLPMFGLLLSSAVNMFFEPPEQLREDAKFWALLFVGLGFLTMLAVPVQHYLFGVAGEKLTERIRSLAFEKVVHQQIGWFDDPANSSGAVGVKLSNDASKARSLVGDTWALIVQNISTVITGLIIAFTANWILAFTVLVVSPVMFVQGYLKTKFIKGFNAKAKVKYEEASQVASEAIGSIRTVASFCAEAKVMDKYQKKCSGPRKQCLVGACQWSWIWFLIFCFILHNCFMFLHRFSTCATQESNF